MSVEVRFAIIKDPNSIFGSVGRCGSGYNTRWNDWSEQGTENIKKINDEWYERYDQITQHYSKLEESIKKEGLRNPIVITCGKPFTRSNQFLPPELRTKHDLLIMEGYDGGSRLWVAQKYNIPVPCIINDRIGKFRDKPLLRSKGEVLKHYKDKPSYFIFSPQKGVTATKLKHSHLNNKYSNPENQAAQIIPLWVDLMLKYGYTPEVRDQHKKHLTPEQIKVLNVVVKGRANTRHISKPPKKNVQHIKKDYSKATPAPLKKLELSASSVQPKIEVVPPPIEKREISKNFAEDRKYPRLEFVKDILETPSIQNAKSKRVVQIGNDLGQLFNHLYDDKRFKRTHFFIVDGSPFMKFGSKNNQNLFFKDLGTTRRLCVQKGIKFLSVIQATDQKWIEKLSKVYFDIVFIRFGFNTEEINYFIKSLIPFLSIHSRIVIELSAKTKDVELGDFSIIDKTKGAISVGIPSSDDLLRIKVQQEEEEKKAAQQEEEKPKRKRRRRRRKRRRNSNGPSPEET